jgi:hypothetical protein
MKSFATFILGLTLCLTVRADVYVESKTIAGTMKAYTSANKQRTEIPNPMTGSPILHVIRLDKGVQWKINPAQNTYDEEPIALPYDQSNNMFSKKDASGEAPQVEVKKRSEKKTIGDFDAEGYDIMTKDSKMTFWMAPISGDIAKANDELLAFNASYSKKLYENFPSKERTDIEEASKAFSGAITSHYGSILSGFKKLPKDLMVGMEGGTPEMAAAGMPEGMMLFQILKIQRITSEDSRFDLPAGAKKVDNVMMSQTMGGGQNMEEMKGQMQEMMKRMQEMQKNGGGKGMPSAQELEEMMKNMPKQGGE